MRCVNKLIDAAIHLLTRELCSSSIGGILPRLFRGCIIFLYHPPEIEGMRRYAAIFFVILFALQSSHRTLAAATREGPPNLDHVRGNAVSEQTLNQATHPQAVYRPGILGHPPLHSFGLRASASDPLATAHGQTAASFRRSVPAEAAGGAPQIAFPATGVNPWWTYEEGAIPAAGRWMVNVSGGNLLLQEDDVDVPERGIDLAFRRTYNSQTRHTYDNADGTVMSNYGNGWTNTLDVHLGYNAATHVLSVYDLDGARYDYTGDGSGNWVAPPGMQGTSLALDGDCGYAWHKKNGSLYEFWLPYSSSACDSSGYAGYRGRVMQIYGRNRNNWVRFDYYWYNGDATNGANLTQLNAVHADGQKLELRFALVSGKSLLSSITRPDGQLIRYAYDANADLTDVCLPGNGTQDASPGAAAVCGDSTHRHSRYGFNNTYQLVWADSPKWTMFWGGASPDGSGGSYVNFGYDDSNRVNSIRLQGYDNFVPNDGTNTALSSAYGTQSRPSYSESLTYLDAGETKLTDVDGHAENWLYDTVGRVTETQQWTGIPNNIWLSSYVYWDDSNNLVASLDPRSTSSTDTAYRTDYAYDSAGNTIAVAQPAVSASVNGAVQTIRPTSLYSYDSRNNVTSYCDPQSNATRARNWNGTGAPPACPTVSGTGAVLLGWAYPAYQPDGQISSLATPLGYTRLFSYAPAAQGGVDYGLPSSVRASQAITQLSGDAITPGQQFAYDAFGNLICYSRSATDSHWWRLAYDQLNRQIALADPDDASLTVSGCSNSAGIPGSHIVTTTTYSLDGHVTSTQTPPSTPLAFGQHLRTTWTAMKRLKYVITIADRRPAPAAPHRSGTTARIVWWKPSSRKMQRMMRCRPLG